MISDVEISREIMRKKHTTLQHLNSAEPINFLRISIKDIEQPKKNHFHRNYVKANYSSKKALQNRQKKKKKWKIR
jgi:hypothetical protein